MHSIPNVVTIAGSDSGGGAGIQADIKTMSSHGCFAASIITAVTAQNTQGVFGVRVMDLNMVEAQFRAVFDDMQVAAVKVGMLANEEIISLVAALLREYKVKNIVVDPVMVAKSGDSLLTASACNSLLNDLLPVATIMTPNLPELAVLLNMQEALTSQEVEEQFSLFADRCAAACLVKGGHLEGETCIDHLWDGKQKLSFTHQRIATNNTHGTGCTLSSALASNLALGLSIIEATRQAIDYVHQAIIGADRLRAGKGHGPLLHFYQHWNDE